ncbi:T9SS type B sorting domain-containing protein [Maribacter sp. MJ134]|uniref:T9SS type B sorting domain-containing protein n=1 Tax=Maribacter sp. MJ134 TaxID=2496865 RepID=UPI000F843A18|nr:T9SS type B sorting domain-containing protein [Maribacter sp. MJ134]AZQ58748.1 T9SS type B sorting domain-containing protein [Maribacter sp. MJ134]
MKKLIIGTFLVLMGNIVQAQDCPNLIGPVDGATNIPVDTSITWENIPGVTGYVISLGTAPNGTDIVNQRAVGSVTTYDPPLGLPENTEIFVTITLFFLNLPDITCPSQSFTTGDVTTPPLCTTIRSPLDGTTNVNSASNISWNYAPTATGYRVSMGTSPNGTDVANNVDVGNTLTYNPPADLPASTLLYITITPYNENGAANLCTETTFTTGAAATLPNCTSLITPADGAINVPLTPFLEWNPVPGATGYRLSIGTSPFDQDILENAVFDTNSTFVIDFEPNRTFFVTITPFNAAGEAIGCTQETFSTILGCGPYFDAVTGELVFLNPEIDFPDEVGICLNNGGTTFTSTDVAEGYRWYKIETGGSETLISTSSEVELSELGEYRYEAFNTAAQSGNTVECPTSKNFNVVVSEAPRISTVLVTEQVSGLRLETIVQGVGSYEFALDDINGPYQDSNIFTNVPAGSYTVYVRDKGGCGTDEERVEQDLTLEGFPKFFTPNGDGVNDFWQYIPPVATGEINVSTITIYDRYGKLLAQISPSSRGWDGMVNGRLLPASDYWFKAISLENREIKGNFSLKR